MKLRKLLIPFIIIASLGAVVLLTGCHRHHHDPEEKAEWIVHKVSKKLDLTDAQRLNLEAVRTEIMQHYKTHDQEKTRLINTLLSEVQKPQMDQKVLMGMVNQHKARIDDISPGVIDKLIEFHASLDDEQKQTIVEKLEKIQKYHHNQEN